MGPRSQRSALERHARSRLTQLVSEQPFLRGSLVEQARRCGKPTCRCRQGHLHHSWYLATRLHDRRVLLYIPRALEPTVRLWVQNGRALSQQVQALHQLQLEQLLQRKQQLSEHRARVKPHRPGRSP
jgi:hypothetical protein